MSQMDVECWKEKRDMEPFMAEASPEASTGSLHRSGGIVGRSVPKSFATSVALGAHGV